MEVRAFPDLVAYLDARLALPTSLRTRIGNERLLYEYYLLNDGHFGGCESTDAARALVAACDGELRERPRQKHDLDRYAMRLEHVADGLATRRPDFAVGLDAGEAVTEARGGLIWTAGARAAHRRDHRAHGAACAGSPSGLRRPP